MDRSTINLTDVAMWTSDPHPTFDWLRANAPVSWQERPDGGFWSITKFDDIVFVNTEPSLFSSSSGVTLSAIPADVASAFEGNILLLDDPDHHWLRAVVSRGFTPNSVRALEPHIRQLATAIVDRASTLGRFDFVDEIAAPLPITVIAELIGMPDHALAREWSEAIENFSSPQPKVKQAALALTRRVAVVLDELAGQRLAEPRNDLLSALVHAEVDGRRLSAAERLGFMLLLNFGANETTRSALAGGMLALLENPAQFDRLRADPSLVPIAVEEFLRYVTPLTNLTRTATAEVVLGGQRIRAGDKVVMWFISGNRDEDVFPDPHRLDVGRMPNRQLSFGAGGPHHCLGAALARLELRVMFELLIDRFPTLRLDGPVVRQESTFVRGVAAMPVVTGPERASRDVGRGAHA